MAEAPTLSREPPGRPSQRSPPAPSRFRGRPAHRVEIHGGVWSPTGSDDLTLAFVSIVPIRWLLARLLAPQVRYDQLRTCCAVC